MRRNISFAFGALTVSSIVLAACGSSGSATARPNSNHVVEITMKDQRFEPNRIEIKTGEKVTFRFTNAGALVHEAYIGTMAKQQAHESEMRSAHGSMSTTSISMSDGAEPVVEVKPGKTGELDYTPTAPGTLMIGCHQSGHFAAGMRATMTVS